MELRGAIGRDAAGLTGLLSYLFLLIIIPWTGAAPSPSANPNRARVAAHHLASIGDAVVTTDTEGRVTYPNATAES
jgi:hypothetical protein